MRDPCEASGLRIKPNADGRGHCPLCGDDWHCLTKDGRLRLHQRMADATSDQVIAVLVELENQRNYPGRVWSGWPDKAAC